MDKILQLLIIFSFGIILAGCVKTSTNSPSSSTKVITSFSFSSPEVVGTISEGTHVISLFVPFGTSVKAITPIIAYTGVKISPDSNSVQDFTNPVTYSVTAADGSTQVYVVTVMVAQAIPAQLKILFLGNSITHNAPVPDLGWYGDWGMAASSQANDYLHIVMSKLSICFASTSFDYKEQTLAIWERDFSTDLTIFPQILDYNPDILIVRLGENVNEDSAKSNNYYAALTKMIKFYATDSTKVVITGVVWTSAYKDSIQKSVAHDNGWQFVDFKNIRADSGNYAYGLFTNASVAAHPSDAGMKAIALALYQKIQEILFKQ